MDFDNSVVLFDSRQQFDATPRFRRLQANRNRRDLDARFAARQPSGFSLRAAVLHRLPRLPAPHGGMWLRPRTDLLPSPSAGGNLTMSLLWSAVAVGFASSIFLSRARSSVSCGAPTAHVSIVIVLAGCAPFFLGAWETRSRANHSKLPRGDSRCGRVLAKARVGPAPSRPGSSYAIRKHRYEKPEDFTPSFPTFGFSRLSKRDLELQNVRRDFSRVVIHAPSCREFSVFGERNIRRICKKYFCLGKESP